MPEHCTSSSFKTSQDTFGVVRMVADKHCQTKNNECKIPDKIRLILLLCLDTIEVLN